MNTELQFNYCDIQAVLAEFGYDLSGPAVPLPGGEDNLNIRVSTSMGELVLRKYLISNQERVQAELLFIRYLHDHGYPTARPIPTQAGQLFTMESEHPIAIFPFINGDVPSSTDVGLAFEMGRLLAALHRLGAVWNGWLPSIDRIEVLQRAAENSLDMAGWRTWISDVNHFLQENEHFMRHEFSELPSGPIHHDLHRGNTLVNGQSIVAVLDFDELNRAPFVIDILRSFHYLAAEEPNYHLRPDKAKSLITGYLTVREVGDLARKSLSRLFNLVNLVDAANFLSLAPRSLNSIDECRSFQIFRSNLNYDFRAVLD